MKKVQIILALLFLNLIAKAQVPQAINYQAVARNNAGAALANQTIQVRLSLMQNGGSLYSETRSVSTNLLGLFNVQIGSPGALITTGNFAGITWLGNNGFPIEIKVELDISNQNVFTDMGTQALSTVPYAFGAANAIETKNLATRPLDVITVPVPGDVLRWNGSSWAPYTVPALPVVQKDSVIPVGYDGTSVPPGGVNAPWVISGVGTFVTLTGNETIVAQWNSNLGQSTVNNIPTVYYAPCYQLLPNGVITEFTTGIYPAESVPANSKIPVSTGGAKKLPAGTYKIGLGIRNLSNTISLNDNGDVNGFIIIKY